MGIYRVVGMCIGNSYHSMLSLLVTTATTNNTITTIDENLYDLTWIIHVASVDTMGHSPYDSLGNTV
jgi:hypothetical protein